MPQDRRTKAQLIDRIFRSEVETRARASDFHTAMNELARLENRLAFVGRAAAKFHAETIRYLEVKAAMTVADIELRAALQDINRNTVALASKE